MNNHIFPIVILYLAVLVVSSFAIKVFANTDDVKYIVTLKQDSLLKSQSNRTNQREKALSAAQATKKIRAIESEQLTFEKRIHHSSFDSISVGTKFTKLVNAVLVTTSEKNIKQIMSFPEVKRIDKVVLHKILQVEDVTDIDLINADQVKSLKINDVNVTGLGVSIAILDTGIDYNHPDLGGCFGADCKVKGGYDFINNHAEPVDDHSHGTIIAGVAAANGELNGIAPDATLLSVKVCDYAGVCPTDKIIAGLEYALNPDGDVNTDDHVDVVNMSIGSPVKDSILIDAINNTVQEGVVVVVGAGNNGPYFDIIGSPGDAGRAITVGASSGNSSIASFSSRGTPVSGSPILKPEIVAPGVRIKSTTLNNSYSTNSGTSLSTPMVSGTVALMKQYAPDRTPEQIKSALIATAAPIVNDVRIEGAGLIDALGAVTMPFNIDVPVILLGESDFNNAVQDIKIDVTLTNEASTEQNFTFDFSETGDNAISIASEINSLLLTTEQSKSLAINASVNIEKLPVPGDNPIYTSYFHISLNDEIYRVPVIFYHRSYFEISYGNYPMNFSNLSIFNDDSNERIDVWSPSSLAGTTQKILKKPGTYNLVDSAYFQDGSLHEIAFLFYSNLKLEKSLSVSISTEQAVNTLVFDIENPHGDKISGDIGLKEQVQGVQLDLFNTSTGEFVHNDFLSFIYVDGDESTFSFSDIPAGYEFHLHSSNSNEDNTEYYNFSTVFNSPIEQNIEVKINKEDYKSIKFEYAVPDYLTTPSEYILNYKKENLLENTSSGSGISVEFPDLAQGKTFYLANMSNDHRFSYLSTKISNDYLGANDQLYTSPYFKFSDQGKLNFYNYYGDDDSVIASQSLGNSVNLTLGKLLPFWSGTVSKQTNGLFAYSYHDRSNAFFKDTHFSYWNNNVILSTNDIEQIVSNNHLYFYNSTDRQSISLPLQSGLIEATANFDGYSFEGKTSEIATNLTFNLNDEMYTPPRIYDLRLSSSGKPTHKMQCGSGEVVVQLESDITNEQVALQIKGHNEDEWQTVDLSFYDGNFKAQLSELAEGFYDISLAVVRNEDNKLNYSASPAFHVATYELNDSDCDGYSDDIDDFPNDANEWLDTDGDGIGNNEDSDDDGDGTEDSIDAFPLDDSETVDTDGDGTGNNADTDDDGDGVTDSADAYPLDSSRSQAPVAPTTTTAASSSGGGGGSFGFLILLIAGLALTQKKLINKTR